MTVSTDKLNKIRLLIKKAQGTDNPHESAAFMNKAQELMAAEGVDMEAVDMAAIGEARIKSRFSVSRPKVYETTLMTAICEAFGCKLLWLKNNSWNRNIGQDTYADFIFVGGRDRLQLAVYAAEVLVPQLKKERQAFADRQAKKYWDIAYESAETEWDRIQIKEDCASMIRKQVTKDADSFAAGWAYKIRQKVVRFALNDKEMLLIDTYCKQQTEDRETKAQDTKLNANYHLGIKAAENASLHRPIEGGGTESVLGETRLIGGK